MRGGKRTGAGRKPGAISKAKRELAEMAKDHAPAALSTLAAIAARGESESARVSAATAILDRAYGKPPQAMTIGGDPDNPVAMVPVLNVYANAADDRPAPAPKAVNGARLNGH